VYTDGTFGIELWKPAFIIYNTEKTAILDKAINAIKSTFPEIVSHCIHLDNEASNTKRAVYVDQDMRSSTIKNIIAAYHDDIASRSFD
jgi:hypothetical protein